MISVDTKAYGRYAHVQIFFLIGTTVSSNVNPEYFALPITRINIIIKVQILERSDYQPVEIV